MGKYNFKWLTKHCIYIPTHTHLISISLSEKRIDIIDGLDKQQRVQKTF